MILVLFDIDGTILLSGGAAVRAVNRAFSNIYGVENAMDGIRADGKTDPMILGEIFNKRLGRDFTREEASRVFNEYVFFLREEITNSEGFRIMPGVPELLNVLTQRMDLVLGVATGNIQQGAQIKLERAGLDSNFKFGGFGSDSEDRGKLIRVAVERGEKVVNHNREFENFFVIGDTPFDIVHGRAAGGKTVAVATGSYSVDDLAEYSPDYLFENFSDFQAVLKIF